MCELAVDFQPRRREANRDAGLAHLYRDRLVDRCIRPLWCAGHLSGLNDKIRSRLRQQKFTRGLEIVKQPVERHQMGVANRDRTVRQHRDIIVGLLEYNRWQGRIGYHRRRLNRVQVVRLSRKSQEVMTARHEVAELPVLDLSPDHQRGSRIK